jgi:hypothetical protein
LGRTGVDAGKIKAEEGEAHEESLPTTIEHRNVGWCKHLKPFYSFQSDFDPFICEKSENLKDPVSIESDEASALAGTNKKGAGQIILLPSVFK